ncbi:NAD(P)H-dependent oxidoreductase [Corynebacterium diphtheriae]|nr:NAD(P)H-dependent oxidoreductase [Corynebacterium diphtheriae]CAB0938534.1 NAD(P)H-dependent oxidoreductase [Corynebacterium diphtheriae]
MKRTIIILAHPNLKDSRVNKALAKAAEKLDSVYIHNLYDLYPDGNINIAIEQENLIEFDHIVFQFPLYWYSTPALLKEWLDKVLTHGWAYGSRGKALVGKTLSLAVSVGSPLLDYQTDGVQEHTVNDYLLPLRKMASYTNLSLTSPFYVGGSFAITDEEIEAQAIAYRHYLEALNKK